MKDRVTINDLNQAAQNISNRGVQYKAIPLDIYDKVVSELAHNSQDKAALNLEIGRLTQIIRRLESELDSLAIPLPGQEVEITKSEDLVSGTIYPVESVDSNGDIDIIINGDELCTLSKGEYRVLPRKSVLDNA